MSDSTADAAPAPRDATEHTRRITRPAGPHTLGFDTDDFERAERGLLATHPTGVIRTDLGVVWDCNRYAFIERDSTNPDTVHPSLWRQAQLNGIHGLFQVDEGIWQARGYDISNVTFIAGATGWIVVDPLTTEPTAAACLALANEHLGERPVTAVIYTHSHADHFGGVLGVTTQADVDAGRCRVIAPEHFMRETVGENVIAGFAMNRRAAYQFGPLLPAGPRQHVDCGLGKAIPFWPSGLIAPTEEITATGTELMVDGVRIVFQLTPETEAPAEMNFFFPDHDGVQRGWLCTAENCTHNMHNLVPIRGALVRDSLRWSKYIAEMIELYGPHIRLMFASHHWPRWGNDDVLQYLRLQRDLYRWMHDQTMRLANQGYVATEIADMLTLPPEFAAHAHTTGYYGSLVHNVKAVYQRYLSWYDGNPANLWKHPPSEAGRRYVELAGGADALLVAARHAYDQGDYRWVVELVNHLVFAEPSNTAARTLQADALEQLGYQSESATFRNAYLTGAQELRHGTLPRHRAGRSGLMAAMSVEQILDSAAIRLNADEVGGLSATVHLHVTDVGEHWRLTLSNRALHGVRAAALDPTAELTLALERAALYALVEGTVSLDDAIATRSVIADGDRAAAAHIFDHLEVFLSNFAIVEP
jgi:alkyl sulfatase BDS1-like metallo-beta-lactamase superfamily hydrolase